MWGRKVAIILSSGLASCKQVVWEDASLYDVCQVTKGHWLSDQCVPVVSGTFCANLHILY